MSVTTPVRRYPPSLSHGNPSGPSRVARPVSEPSSSIDDEVPPPPKLGPLPTSGTAQQQVPELSSLEHLLRQAGYKETRVFTPEAERARARLKMTFDDEAETEVANLYAIMGLNNEVPAHIRHLTRPAIPFRSSSSVLRSVALQDASKTLNERGPHGPDDSWWKSTFLNRAAQTVGRTVAAMSPPNDDGMEEYAVGLGLARGGNGVRKVVSNYELGRKPNANLLDRRQEDIPPVCEDSPPRPKYESAPSTTVVPPSKHLGGTEAFSPPAIHVEHHQFDDDVLAYSGLPEDYETQQDDDDYMMDDAVSSYSDSSTTLGRSPPERYASPPLLDAKEVLADLGLSNDADADCNSSADEDEIREAEEEAVAIGQRILAATVEYDEASDEDDSPPPSRPLLPRIGIQPPSPPKLAGPTVEIAEAMADIMVPATPTPVQPVAARALPVSPKSKLRAAQSAPALRKPRHQKSHPFLLGAPRTKPAAPALQIASPVVCDSLSNDAEDLPPLPTYVAPAPPQSTGFGSFALRAKQSLSALRAAFWAAEEPKADQTSDDTSQNSTTPILTPRIDWEAQGATIAGWGSSPGKKPWTRAPGSYSRSSIDSTGSTGTMAELNDPFADDGSIDYTKSFFYKPGTPPRPGKSSDSTSSSSSHKLRKKASVKSLQAALLLPTAPPPVPAIPDRYKNKNKSGNRTPPLAFNGRPIEPPQLFVHSPNAWEEGRPARPIVLEGEEWDGRDIVSNWGSGVRRRTRRSKRRSRLSYDCEYDCDPF